MKHLIQLSIAFLISIVGYLELAGELSGFLTGLGVGLILAVLITQVSNYFKTKTL